MILWCFLGLALANPASMLEAANDHYLAGEYAAAAQGYGTLIQTGHASGDLYYNLGNARYREGELAQAVLAWKRAEWLLPRDGDILANLDRARGQAVDGIATDSGPRIYFLSRMLSVGEQAWAAAWLLGLLGLLFGWRRARAGASLSIPVVLLGVPGALLLVSAAGEMHRQTRQTPAVLVAPHGRGGDPGAGGGQAPHFPAGRSPGLGSRGGPGRGPACGTHARVIHPRLQEFPCVPSQSFWCSFPSPAAAGSDESSTSPMPSSATTAPSRSG